MPTNHLNPIKPQTIEATKRRFNIIGNAPTLNHAITTALRIAPTHMNILITGENGSGKEAFSKIIHQNSNQKHQKLIAVNCGALPQGTIDSELFGHEKGAFTGAHETRKGYFQEANNGTIFLDEIGEMPLATQARLLRVLEYGEFIKVGSSKVEKTQTRLIAATHINLRNAVAKGHFREDLYHRLNTVTLSIPPLRERGNDIILLLKKFSADFSETYGGKTLQLTNEAQKTLMAYPFPGNIRELKNLVVRISVLTNNTTPLTAQQLKSYLPKPQKNDLPATLPNLPQPNTKQLSEREILYKVLFDMQQDLIALKKIVFKNLTPENPNHHPSQKHPLLFSTPQKNNTIPQPTQPPLPLHDNTPTNHPTPQQQEIIPLETMEKQAISNALKKYQYNRKKAAQALQIPERTLYRKIKKYKL